MAAPPPPGVTPGMPQNFVPGMPPHFAMPGGRPPLIPVPPAMMMGMPGCKLSSHFVCLCPSLFFLFLCSTSTITASSHSRGRNTTIVSDYHSLNLSLSLQGNGNNDGSRNAGPSQGESVCVAIRVIIFSSQPVSISEMKGATTVFVGNITDKATDTLMKQILLVCATVLLHTPYCVLTEMWAHLSTGSVCKMQLASCKVPDCLTS